MCHNHYDSLRSAIIPILTKVKVTDQDFDLDLIRDNLAQQMQLEIDSQISKAKGYIKMMAEEGLEQTENADQNEMLEEIKGHGDFLNELAYSIVAYDPLERSIPPDCEDPAEN